MSDFVRKFKIILGNGLKKQLYETDLLEINKLRGGPMDLRSDFSDHLERSEIFHVFDEWSYIWCSGFCRLLPTLAETSLYIASTQRSRRLYGSLPPLPH